MAKINSAACTLKLASFCFRERNTYIPQNIYDSSLSFNERSCYLEYSPNAKDIDEAHQDTYNKSVASDVSFLDIS